MSVKRNAFARSSRGRRGGARQRRVLSTLILPRVALYQVLSEIPMEKKDALSVVEKYFLIGIRKSRDSLLHVERIPFFYSIFRLILVIVLRADNWKLTVGQNDNKSFRFTVTQCLWNDAFNELGCPEMCKMSCESDFIMYGSMRKISFQRSKTLGTGGDYCDFCFSKK